MKNLIRKILKEGVNDDLNYVYNKIIKNGLVKSKNINKYSNYFEIYKIESRDFPYFEDNWIKVEVLDSGMIYLTFIMYEDDIDYKEAEEVSYWLWGVLSDMFEGEYEVMDNI